MKRIPIRNSDELIDYGHVKCSRHEILSYALDKVWMSLLLLSLKLLIKYGPFRIDAHNPNLTLPFLQVPTRPRDRPARSNPTDEHVQLPISLPVYLRTSSLIMCQGIHLVHILIGHETIGRLPSQSFSNSNVVLWRIWRNICGCYNDLCAEGSEQRSLLLTHLVRHREDHLVTLPS